MGKIFLTLFLLATTLLGCKEVTIQDGRIPTEYLAQAKLLAGKYTGTFDGKQAQIDLYFIEDRPFIKYTDTQGHDPLDVSCNSKIDLLKTIVLNKQNGKYVLDQASFGFHPGTCRIVKGRTFDLDFSGTHRFSASIYEYSEYNPRCNPGYPPNNGTCTTVETPRYITGKFSR